MTLSLKRLLTTGVLLIWMAVIFAFSQQPGSGSTWEPPLWYILERKSAHIIEYAIFFILASASFRLWFPRDTKVRVFGLALIAAITYGISDEIHQAFVFGRGSRFTDVLIDAGGAMVGMLVLLVFERLKHLQRK